MRIAHLKDKIREKDKIIRDCRHTIDTHNATITRKQSINDNNLKKLKNLTECLKILDAKLKESEEELEKSEERIKNLEKQCQKYSENCTAVRKSEGGQYEVDFIPPSPGWYHFDVKVHGSDIKGSSFDVKWPVLEFNTPVRTIEGVGIPVGIAINDRGETLVTHCNKGVFCVSIFDLRGDAKRITDDVSGRFSRLGQPGGVTVDDKNNVFVADYENGRLHLLSASGECIKSDKTGSFNPLGIKYNSRTKQVYVADQGGQKMHVFDSELNKWKTFGSGQLICPYDVAFDSDNNIYVTDGMRGRIHVFSEEGTYLRQIGEQGRSEGQLFIPNMIAIDKEDLVYITELGNHRVSVFTREGDHLTSFGSKGNGPQNFFQPFGIAVDDSGMVYVCDSGNNRILVFQKMHGNVTVIYRHAGKRAITTSKMVSNKYMLPATIEERRSIYKAFDGEKGSWCKCPNGHYYRVGDCGNPCATGKCLDCSSEIGGQNSQLLASNKPASETDKFH